MINKELKLKYIKSLKSGGRVPKYQTAWGTLDEKKKAIEKRVDDWQWYLTPASGSKFMRQWRETGERPKQETPEEYTKRRIKEEENAAKKRTRHIKRAANTAHMIGTLATGAGTAGLLLTNPATALGAITGGVVGEKAVDYGLDKLADATGSNVRSWKDLTDKYLGWSPTLQMLTNPGTIIGGGIGAKGAQLSKGAMDYLIAMNNLNKGLPLTTRYYFKPGYLGANSGPIGKIPEVPEGWEIIRPLTINGRNTYQVKHPTYGFSTLDEVNGTYGRGNYAKLFTNEALDEYNPEIRQDPSNNKLIDEARYIARRVDAGKDSPVVIDNTEEYHQYPKIWDILLKTQIGKREYPNGATIVGRGLWPGSSKIAKSPNYDALFLGYNRDMGMPYMRIGSDLGGKNNFGLPQYEKYFSPEKVKKLREIDKEIESMITTKSYYSQEYADQLYRLHNQRAALLGDKLPEFGGFQQLLVPNASNGKMLNTVLPSGLAMEGGTFGDLGAGQPITIPKLAGDQLFYDANSVSSALASEGPAKNIYGVFLHSDHPSYTGIHDKGVGSTLIWNQDGFAPFLKSIHGNSLKNLSGTIESAYKKGGKFLKKSK